jgi:transposase
MDKTKISCTFSESFKRAKVAEIYYSKIKISDSVRIYGIETITLGNGLKNTLYSPKPIQEWSLNWFGSPLQSDSLKTEQLAKKVAELERIIGQKQLEMIGWHSAF